MAITTRIPSSGFIDLEVESELIRACLQKPGFAQRLVSRIPNEIFTNEIHLWIVEQIRLLLRQNRGRLPRIPVDVLKHLASKLEDVDKRAIYVQAIDALYKKPVEYEAFAESQIREYASHQVVTSSIRESFSQHKNHNDIKKTIGELEESIKRARAILSDAEVYDYTTQWQDREKERSLNLDIGVRNTVVKLGIPKFDAQIRMTPGTVHGFLAPFKRYKSIVLNHVGFAAFMQGYNVLHVTLENTVDLTASRYDARFASIEHKKLVEAARSEAEREHFEKVFGQISSWPQKLKIFSGPANHTSVDDVSAEIDHLEIEEGFSPEVVLLDYGNIFAPSVDMKGKDDHQVQTQIVWDMQKLAKRSRMQRVVVTAFQSKSEGIKAERLQNDQIGKSIGISQAVDGMIAINQNANEKPLGIITLSPMFIRYGPIMCDDVTLESDFSKMCIDRESDRLLWAESLTWEHPGG